jgi:hypothetical protein
MEGENEKKGAVTKTSEGLKLTNSIGTVKIDQSNKVGKAGQGDAADARWLRKLNGDENSRVTSAMGAPGPEPPPAGPSPGAYRIAGIGDEEDCFGSINNEINSVTAGSSTVASTAQVSTTTQQPNTDFVVPIARTVVNLW